MFTNKRKGNFIELIELYELYDPLFGISKAESEIQIEHVVTSCLQYNKNGLADLRMNLRNSSRATGTKVEYHGIPP